MDESDIVEAIPDFLDVEISIEPNDDGDGNVISIRGEDRGELYAGEIALDDVSEYPIDIQQRSVVNLVRTIVEQAMEDNFEQ